MSMKQAAFTPPERILMGPGPSQVHPRVLEALARPTIGHLDPAFIGLMDEIKAGLREVFRTGNQLTLPISAPGSAGQETCIVNLLEPGDTFIACVNGVFGERMALMAERAGAKVLRLQQAWGQAVDPQALRELLKTHPETKLVGFVHAETSTGVLSDIKTLAEVAHEFGALALADTVTSLGGVPVEIDAWQIDASYSGTQKCLSCPPGLSPATFSPRAVEAITARKTPVRSWFLDLSLLISYWNGEGKRSYHHTAPVNALYGLHEALLLVVEEGLSRSWERHERLHRALVSGLEAMGLSLYVSPEQRLIPLNTVNIPEGVDEAAIRQQLLSQYNLEIGAGLGPMAGKIWRIGLMGHSCNEGHVMLLLEALEQTLGGAGAAINRGVARGAAEAQVTALAA